MPQLIAFRGVTLYLFLGGLAALFVTPFLPWYNYGMNFMFPAQVSLVFLFQAGYRLSLVLYLGGIAAAIVAVVIARRPVFFQGALSAAVPLLVFSAASIPPVVFGYPRYLQVLTLGMFAALLGSALLEASYFSYRRQRRSIKKSEIPITIENEDAKLK